MKKTSVKMNKSVYLGMSILDIKKTLMYGFWYDYVKPKYMDTDSFAINIFTEVFFEEINVIIPKSIHQCLERCFDTSNFD